MKKNIIIIFLIFVFGISGLPFCYEQDSRIDEFYEAVEIHNAAMDNIYTEIKTFLYSIDFKKFTTEQHLAEFKNEWTARIVNPMEEEIQKLGNTSFKDENLIKIKANLLDSREKILQETKNVISDLSISNYRDKFKVYFQRHKQLVEDLDSQFQMDFEEYLMGQGMDYEN